jgi:hypothetical protein
MTYDTAQNQLADTAKQIADYHANYASNLQSATDTANTQAGVPGLTSASDTLRSNLTDLAGQIAAAQGKLQATPGEVLNKVRGFDVNASQLGGKTKIAEMPIKGEVSQLGQSKNQTSSQLAENTNQLNQAKNAVTKALSLWRTQQAGNLSGLTEQQSRLKGIVSDITKQINWQISQQNKAEAKQAAAEARATAKAQTAALRASRLAQTTNPGYQTPAEQRTTAKNLASLQQANNVLVKNNDWVRAWNTLKTGSSGLDSMQADLVLINSLSHSGVPQSVIDEGINAVMGGAKGVDWWQSSGQFKAGLNKGGK